MNESISPWQAVLLGLFVVIAGGLAVTGLFAVAQHDWIFQPTFELRAEFPAIGGVQQGTRVRLQGMDAGLVDRIVPPQQPGEPVIVHMRLDAQYRTLIRKDAIASLSTQGIIGTKVVEIDPGSTSAAAIEDGDAIGSQPPIELSQVLADTYETGKELREMGQKLDGILTRLDHMATQVEAGEGTLGKIVTTDEAHQAAMELMQSADEVMTNIDESLTALRRVWPLRDYFIGQGMNDPDELLYRPGARREVRAYSSKRLFEPGRSVLTSTGRKALDDAALWLKGITAAESEIVIAAFDGTESNRARSQRLTQGQANAVRDYLVSNHAVNKLGFFARREVTAAGFADRLPMSEDMPNRNQQVLIIVFIPEQ